MNTARKSQNSLNYLKSKRENYLVKRNHRYQAVDPVRLAITVTAMTLLELTVVVYLTSVVVSWVLG